MGDVIAPSDGWGAIVVALAEAQRGDVIELASGVFEGEETLTIPSGVALQGAGSSGDAAEPGPGATVLRFGADAPAIALSGVSDVSLSGCRIVMTSESIARRALPDGELLWPNEMTPIEWGAVFADDAKNIDLRDLAVTCLHTDLVLCGIVLRLCSVARVSNCAVFGMDGYGIGAVSSTEVAIERCTAHHLEHGIVLLRSAWNSDAPSTARILGARCYENAAVGIALLSSTAETIEDSECWSNGIFGISLERDPRSLYAPSIAARIGGARCHDNGQSGIILTSSTAEAIEDCECRSNGRNGITLQRAAICPDAPSTVDRIGGARCHDNGEVGIILSSSTAEAIEDCECWGNGHGILLQRGNLGSDGPSTVARIVRTRCHDNGQTGIVLLSSTAEAIEDCECWGNGHCGIILDRHDKSPNAHSNARIRRARCHRNGIGGIVLLSSLAEAIEECECWANGFHGVWLGLSSRSPDAPSTAARIGGARCHDNGQVGIVLFSSIAEAIEDCECWGNGIDGVALQRDEKSPDVPSVATRIRRARCHDNKVGGINFLSSTSEAIEDCECWGNGVYGVALQRDEKSPDVPSVAIRISGARCHDNAQSGISLLSSEAKAIEDCECWGNGWHGLSLERDAKSPDAPSRALIIGACCHDNTQSGIILFSSKAEAIEHCECWGNGLQGIVLERDPKSLDAPSRARISHARCHDNTQSGISLLSSEAEAIEHCECWGNGWHGVALELDPKSPDAPSCAQISHARCHDNSESGIILFSSKAEAIEHCECWGNGINGVALQRDKKSPGAPPVARICGTACFDNRAAGFDLMDGDILELSSNRSFGNDAPLRIPSPLRLMSNAEHRSPDASVPQVAVDTITESDIIAEVRTRTFGGLLANRIEAAGFDHPDALARFVSGCGCARCLAEAWSGSTGAEPANGTATERSGDQKPAKQPKAETLKAMSLLPEEDEDGLVIRVEPLPLQESDLDAFARGAIRTAARGKGETILIGTVGLADGEFDAFAAKLRHLDDARNRAEEARTALAHALKDRRIEGPLNVPYALRSLNAMRGEGDRFPLLEAELAEREARPRLGFALHPAHLAMQVTLFVVFLALLTLLASAAKMELPWMPLVRWARATLTEAPGAWLTWLIGWTKQGLSASSAIGVISMGTVIGAWIALSFRAFNRRLPFVLRLRLQPFVQSFLDNLGAGKLVGGSLHSERPWQRWAKRCLFGGTLRPLLTVVVFDEPDMWSAADVARLRQLATMRDPDQSLIVLMRLQSVSQVPSALFKPFLQDGESGERVVGIDRAALFVSETAEDLLAETADPPPDFGPLLGLQGRDDDELIEVRDGLTDDRWTAEDLIPTLAIGSVTAAPLVFEYDRQDRDPSLSETVAPFARLFPALRRSAEQEPTPALFRDLAERNEIARRVKASSATFQYLKDGCVRLYGRAGFRHALARSLRPLFKSEAAWRDYIWRLIACGEIHNLNQGTLLLSGQTNSLRIDEVLRHMRAAVALRRDRSGWPPGELRSPMLVAAWQQMAAANHRLEQVDESEDPRRVEMAGLLLHATEPLGDQPGELEADAVHLKESSLLRAFQTFLHRTERIDPDYVQQLVERRFATDWAFLHSRTKEYLREETIRRTRRNPTLYECLVSAENFEAFETVVRLHAGIMPSVVATAYAMAARAARNDEDRLALAALMRDHATAGVWIDTAIRTGPTDSQTSRLPAHLADPRTVALFLSRPDPQPPRPIGLHFGSLDPINKIVERIVTIGT